MNRLRDATTVRRCGMEQESVCDGLSVWSPTGASVAPMIAPGDSFTVAFTPSRAMEAVMTVEIEGAVRRQRFVVR